MPAIENPKDGVAFCNKHIAKLEELIEVCEAKGDIELATKLRFQLVKWAEQLQHYLRQTWQQGMATEELTKSVQQKKKRFEGEQ